MKKVLISLFVFSFFSLPLLSFAQEWSWGNYGNDPISILDKVVQEANQDGKIQQTALDGITDQQWAYAKQYKIANTLDRIRKNINPYLQRAVYIGLSVAVILLIYNGFLMVTNSVHGEWDISKIKNRFIYILVWVLLLTGFYFVIKLAVALINSIFGWYWGDTGF
jgi:hypothetical protein